jgi:hypothetical protein
MDARRHEEERLDNVRKKGKSGKEVEKAESSLRLGVQQEHFHFKRHQFALVCLLQELHVFHQYRSIVSNLFRDYARCRFDHASAVSIDRFDSRRSSSNACVTLCSGMIAVETKLGAIVSPSRYSAHKRLLVGRRPAMLRRWPRPIIRRHLMR